MPDGQLLDDMAPPAAPAAGMRWIAGGTFRMGADRSYPEEAPVHTVTVSGFYMDKHTVTNAEFAASAEATGYWAGAVHAAVIAVYGIDE